LRPLDGNVPVVIVISPGEYPASDVIELGKRRGFTGESAARREVEQSAV